MNFLNELIAEVLVIINICEKAVADYQKGDYAIIDEIQMDVIKNARQVYFNQINNIILQEMKCLHVHLQRTPLQLNEYDQIKSSWIVSDSWSYEAELSKKITNVAKKVRSIRSNR